MTTWPDPIDRYLADVGRALDPLPPAQRADVLAGIEAHLSDALAEGASPAAVIADLGTPEAIAAQALEDAAPPRPRYLGPRRIAQIVAFAFALFVSIGLATVIPVYTTVTTSQSECVLTTSPDGSSGSGTCTPAPAETVESTATLADANGPFVVAVVLIPIFLTLLPLVALGRVHLPVSIVGTVLLAAGCAIAGFTIGLFYVPALLASAVALFLPTAAKMRA